MHLKILKELKYLHQICLYIMFFGLELDIISNMTDIFKFVQCNNFRKTIFT